MKTAPCRGCGAEVIWAKGPDNKPIPLDARSIVYSVVLDEAGGYTCTRIRPSESERGHHTVVPLTGHLSHCPKASAFSKSDRAASDAAAAFEPAPDPEPAAPEQQDFLMQRFTETR